MRYSEKAGFAAILEVLGGRLDVRLKDADLHRVTGLERVTEQLNVDLADNRTGIKTPQSFDAYVQRIRQRRI